MLDVIAIGNPGIDFLYTDKGVIKAGGGSAPNTMARLQKLGMKTGVIGWVSTDSYGKAFLEEFKQRGMCTKRLRVTDAPTMEAHIQVSPEDRRIVSMKNYKRVNFSIVDKEYFKSARAILLCVRRRQFKKYLDFALKYIPTVYVTLHHSENTRFDAKLLDNPRIKAVLANEDEVKDIKNLKTRLIITRGKKGCSVYSGGQEKHFPGFKVKTVDPTGAGDAFAAGFIFGDMKGWDLDRCCTFANACGALATTCYGSRENIPSVEEVNEFIRLNQKV